jgi:endoglucanase
MSKSMRALLASLAGVMALGGAIPLSGALAARAPAPARAALAQPCGDPFSAQRDPANPLALPAAPGSNPLRGAHFFVDGPAHGAAAGAIATMLGLDPHRFADHESWARFAHSLDHGALHRRMAGDRGLTFRVHELEKVAAQPEVQRLSSYAMGGGPGAIFAQTEKLLCHNFTADRGTIPLLNTYFLHPAAGSCPSPAALAAAGPTFRRRVTELAQAVARRPAVFLLETDGIGTTRCIARAGSLPLWEADLRYEIGQIAALPHSVVYVEGGYSDSNSVRYTARVLNAIGIRRIRGFYTNDTHEQWTIKEVRWAERVSRLTHGAHFIVNTAQNGRGPLLNPHPVTEGVEDLCNPPGRGLGPRDTTRTGFRNADAWLWTSPPGNSSGCGGGPSGGTFWPARAISLAARANDRLGPGYPSRPY